MIAVTYVFTCDRCARIQHHPYNSVPPTWIAGEVTRTEGRLRLLHLCPNCIEEFDKFLQGPK